MGAGAFQQGSTVKISGKFYIFLRRVAPETWQLEEIHTKRIIERTDTQLRQEYLDGALRFMGEKILPSEFNKTSTGAVHNEYPLEAWHIARLRRAYVVAVLDLPSSKKVIRPVIHKSWERMHRASMGSENDSMEKLPEEPSASSVLRWKKRYIAAGRDIRSLMDNNAGKGNRNRRYPNEVVELVKKAVEKIYLTRERKTIQDTVDYAQAQVIAENKLRPKALQLPLPKRRFIENIISTMSAFDVYAARYGRQAAVMKFRSVVGQHITQAPLERAEIDHTKLDLFVIDDETGMPMGRPWLTCCIDDYSRCDLGIHLGFEPPGYLTVAYCLKNALLPKTDLKAKYKGIKNHWEAHGVMRELVVDNGPEFHSQNLENACLTLSIEIHYAPRKKPWFKGEIERFIKTLNAEIAHGNPGTTFSNIFEKDDYDPTKHAVVRFSTCQEIVRKWIVDVYHQRPHRTLQAPPAEVWTKSIAPEDILVPNDPSELDAILGRSEIRKLTHKGIELDSLLYNSHELTELRYRFGHSLEVDVRADDSNLGHITVLSPDKTQRFRVQALNYEYANGLTRWQHRVCKRFAADRMNRYDASAWIEAKAAIVRLIDDEIERPKSRGHARIARYTHPQAATYPHDCSGGTTEAIQNLENKPQIISTLDSKSSTGEYSNSEGKRASTEFTFRPRYRKRTEGHIDFAHNRE
jgi:putative transposase